MTHSPLGPEELLALMPYARGTGIRLEKADAGLVRGTLPWAEHLCTAGRVLHGGAVMSLADTVGAVCAYLNLPSGAATSTVESKTNFFRGVQSGTVTAVARPLHVGSSFVVVQTELSDDEERPVALTIQSQAVLRPGSARSEPASG